MGYWRAGFDVVGVDTKPQPNYPFMFHQADAMTFPLDGFDAVHASPPCQGYSNLRRKIAHPRLIAPLRDRLVRWQVTTYVIENIEDARRELHNPVRMCGSTFNLNVRRHRWFECNFPVMVPPCQHDGREIRAYYGKKGWLVWTPGAAAVQKQGRKPILRGRVEQAAEDMGIDWMTWDELREAIPPAYTEFIGEQLLKVVSAEATSS
jgi:DNA (cytosine-5)-methyltransferase 1